MHINCWHIYLKQIRTKINLFFLTFHGIFQKSSPHPQAQRNRPTLQSSIIYNFTLYYFMAKKYSRPIKITGISLSRQRKTKIHRKIVPNHITDVVRLVACLLAFPLDRLVACAATRVGECARRLKTKATYDCYRSVVPPPITEFTSDDWETIVVHMFDWSNC